MKVVAMIPIKLNSQRIPQKNTLQLGNKPLCRYIFDTTLKCSSIDAAYVYCSDEAIKDYIPNGIRYLQREKSLDRDETKGMEIYRSFVSAVDADVYVLLHTTSPFVSANNIEKGIASVVSGKYDSALAVQRIQTFTWHNGSPLNYILKDIPRTQDISPIYVETSAFYIFTKDMFFSLGQRVGNSPCFVELNNIESIDIDEPTDFELASIIVTATDGNVNNNR